MRDLALAFIVFGSLPFILRRPFLGILMMAWLGYMNPHRLCFGFMLSFPVVQVVAIATLIGMLVSKEAKRMVWSREIVILVVFVAWMGITTSQALYFDYAVEQYTKVIKIQILTILTLVMLTSKEKVHLFVWVVVLSLGYYGLKGGVFTLLTGGEHRVWGPEGTFIGGNNEVALALVMTIPLMRYLHMREKRMWLRHALLMLMILSAISAIGTQSRGALVALTLTGMIFWLKSRGKLLSGILIVMAAGMVLMFMPEAWFERMSTIRTYQQDDSALGRINAWWTAFNVANARFFGGGFEMFQPPTFYAFAPEPYRVHDVHSIYFEALGEHGWVGLILFVSLLVFTWLKCGATIRIGKRHPAHEWARDLGRMIQVSIVGYMTGGAFLGLAYFDYIYHLVALSVVAHHLVRQRADPAAEPALSEKLASPARPRPIGMSAIRF